MLENFKPSDIQPSVESTKDNSLKMPEVKDLPPLGGEENPSKEIKPLPKVEDLPLENKSEVKKELTPLSEESKEELKDKGYPDSVIENIGSEEEKEIYETLTTSIRNTYGKEKLQRILKRYHTFYI